MSCQRLKPLILLDILKNLTDKSHPISLKEITAELLKHGIKAERKSIYKNIKALADYGAEISYTRSPKAGYYIKNKSFKPGEIQVLIDIVKCADFINQQAAQSIIQRLICYLSINQAKLLNTSASGKKRSNNTKLYDNVETITIAMSKKLKARILYENISLNANQNMIKTEEWRVINPHEFYYDGEDYFLKIYDEKNTKFEKIKARRILKAQIFTEDYRANNISAERQNLAEIRCNNALLQEILEVFGDEIILRASGREHFVAKVNFCEKREILPCILKFGDTVEVISPIELRRAMREKIRRMSRVYKIYI